MPLEDKTLENQFSEDEARLIEENRIFKALLEKGVLNAQRGRSVAILKGNVVAIADTIKHLAKQAYSLHDYQAMLFKHVPLSEAEQIRLDYIE